ncbi:hypothetical protein AB4347_00335, partial [Vibrio breoganii]
ILVLPSILFLILDLLYQSDSRSHFIPLLNGDFKVNFNQLLKAMLTFQIFSFLNILEKKGWDSMSLNKIADYSFGIFFIHWYFLKIITKAIEVSVGINNYGAEYFIIGILAIVMSMIAIKIVKIIFTNRSRFVIGC